jgi:F-type H+-transporting ATPase subunit gamma
VRVQQAQGALNAIRTYTAVVEGALAEALTLGARSGEPPAASGAETGTTAIVFSSEQGFVGAFNERVLDRAAAEISRPDDRLLVVGARGASLARERHLAVAWTAPMATHGCGVVGVARAVVREVSRRANQGQLQRVALVYARSSAGAVSEVVVSTLLPFDPAQYRPAGAGAAPPPLTNLAPGALIDGLVDELLQAALMRAAMESFAGENGARLATMESAHTSIARKIDDLSQDERRRRQDEITTELLDIVTGAEAVSGERPR